MWNRTSPTGPYAQRRSIGPYVRGIPPDQFLFHQTISMEHDRSAAAHEDPVTSSGAKRSSSVTPQHEKIIQGSSLCCRSETSVGMVVVVEFFLQSRKLLVSCDLKHSRRKQGSASDVLGQCCCCCCWHSCSSIFLNLRVGEERAHIPETSFTFTYRQ